jgi:hypothetical protein
MSNLAPIKVVIKIEIALSPKEKVPANHIKTEENLLKHKIICLPALKLIASTLTKIPTSTSKFSS